MYGVWHYKCAQGNNSSDLYSYFGYTQTEHGVTWLTLSVVFLTPSRQGRAVAQAVSRWLPTAAARVRVRAACEVCGGQSGTGAGFLRVLRFPLPIIFHQFLHHHNHPGHNRPISGRSAEWTLGFHPPHYTN
jgi:hypothetical protein